MVCARAFTSSAFCVFFCKQFSLFVFFSLRAHLDNSSKSTRHNRIPPTPFEFVIFFIALGRAAVLSVRLQGNHARQMESESFENKLKEKTERVHKKEQSVSTTVQRD